MSSLRAKLLASIHSPLRSGWLLETVESWPRVQVCPCILSLDQQLLKEAIVRSMVTIHNPYPSNVLWRVVLTTSVRYRIDLGMPDKGLPRVREATGTRISHLSIDRGLPYRIHCHPELGDCIRGLWRLPLSYWSNFELYGPLKEPYGNQ